MTTRLVRLETVESCSRALLVDLLSPWRAFFRARGVDLAALRTAGPSLEADAPLRGLATVLAAPDVDMPPELRARLETWDALATPEGSERIDGAMRRRDVIAFGAELAESDLAATVLLHHADVAAEASLLVRRVERARLLRFSPPKARGVHALPDGFVDGLRRAASAHFSSRRRGAYLDVHVIDTAGEIVVEVVHGEIRRAEHEIAEESRRERRSVRPARSDLLVVDKETGDLSLGARTPADRELYRQTAGELLGDGPEHFQSVVAGEALVHLAPLLAAPTRARDATTHDLVEVTLVREDRPRVALSAPDGVLDYLHTLEGRTLTKGAVATHATCVVRFADGAKVRFELRPPGLVHVVSGPREREDEARAYLVARGAVRAPRRAAGRTHG